MALTKKDIFKHIDKLKREEVPIPEWGGAVWVQEMNAAQRDAFDDWIVSDTKDVSEIRAKIASITVVDENGKNLFGPLDVGDIKRMSSTAVGRISTVAFKLSGMAAEEINKDLKNSDAVQSDDSNSASVES